MLRRIILAIFLCHSAVSLYVLGKTGLLSVFPPFNELYVYQIISDLGASLGVVLLLLGVELKRKRKSLNPLIPVGIGVILIGSFSPMIYLLIERDLFD